MSKNKFLIKPEEIQNCIQEIRGHKIIIDSDLAKFYGIETRRLEVEILMSQYAISSSHGGRRKMKRFLVLLNS